MRLMLFCLGILLLLPFLSALPDIQDNTTITGDFVHAETVPCLAWTPTALECKYNPELNLVWIKLIQSGDGSETYPLEVLSAVFTEYGKSRAENLILRLEPHEVKEIVVNVSEVLSKKAKLSLAAGLSLPSDRSKVIICPSSGTGITCPISSDTFWGVPQPKIFNGTLPISHPFKVTSSKGDFRTLSIIVGIIMVVILLVVLYLYGRSLKLKKKA